MSEQELMGSGKGWEVQQLQAANIQLRQHIGWWMQLQAGASLSKGSVTILGNQRVYKQVATDPKCNFWGWHTTIMQHLSYLFGHKPKKPNKQNTSKNIITSLCFRKILHTFNMSPHSPYSIGVTRQLWDGHFRYLRVNRKKVLLQTDVYYSTLPNHQQFLGFPTTGQES